jgi:hypothetical protein
MPTTCRADDLDQLLLLPASLRAWLPERHLAFFVADAVDAVYLQAFYARYEGDGRQRQPFAPSISPASTPGRTTPSRSRAAG